MGEGDDVEDVVPQEMLADNVVFESDSLFLQVLSGHVAHVAEIGFITLECLVCLPQPCKSIQHDAGHNVAEEQSEKYGINCVEPESSDLEFGHGLANGAGDEQSQQATGHAVAHFVGGLSIDIFDIVAKGDSTENESEDHTHKTDVN